MEWTGNVSIRPIVSPKGLLQASLPCPLGRGIIPAASIEIGGGILSAKDRTVIRDNHTKKDVIDHKPQGVAPDDRRISLSDIVHRFKSFTTNRYAKGVKESGWHSFPGRLWQRNYYERIIRDDDEMNRDREYIEVDPQIWEIDEENPNILSGSKPSR